MIQHIQHSVTNTCVSIQTADKPIEHLIYSYKLLFVLLILDKKIDAISAYLKSNNKGDIKKCLLAQAVRKVQMRE